MRDVRLNRHAILATAGIIVAAFLTLPAAAQSVPEAINHQGYIEVNGQPYDGQGNFYFALVDNNGNNVWTHDGSQLGTSNQPNLDVTLPVNEGVYTVALGDSNEMTAFPANLFANNADLRLRTWFDDGQNGVQQLIPDKPLQSVPYARTAGSAASAGSIPSVISVDQVNYNTPRVHQHLVPAAAFKVAQTASQDRGFGSDIGAIVGSTNATFIAPVSIPDGARITTVEFFFLDNDGDSDVTIQFVKEEFEAIDTPTVIASANTSGHTGGSSVAKNISETVNYGTYSYAVIASDDSVDWGSEMKLRGALFTYELDAAL